MEVAPDDISATLDQLVRTFGDANDCPSISWGVVDGGRLSLHGAYRSVHPSISATEGTQPNVIDEHTVYRIASMTKAFSAAATLLLRDEGALRLDDALTTHAPELAGLRGPTSDSPPITIRDLLTMRAGFASDDHWADRRLDLTDDEFDQIVEAGVTFAEPTGAVHEYSNFGFGVLGRVIHRATGQRIQQVISDRLLTPLGMHETTWVQPEHNRWARPMEWHSERFHDELPPMPDGLIAPMGGLWTTVHDMTTWVGWLDDAFPARDGADVSPLSRASRREMQTEQAYVGHRTLRGLRSPTSYGYGLRVIHEAHRVVTHSGGLPGYGSNMRWVSGSGVGVIALGNSTYAPMTELTALILDVVLEHQSYAAADRSVTPELASAAARLVELFNEWSDDAADRLFCSNVAPDESYERRRATLQGLLPLTIDSIQASNDANATISIAAADGSTPTIWFSLSPIAADQIQAAEVTLTTT